ALPSRLQGAQQALQNPNQTPTTEQIQNLFGIAGHLLAIAGALALVAVFIVQPLATAATARAVSDRYLDREASIGSSYRAALRRLLPLIAQSLILTGVFILIIGLAAALVTMLGVAGGSSTIPIDFIVVLAVVVLAVLVYTRTSLAAPAIVLEHLSGWRGLRRSWGLVRGLFWR